MDTLENLHGHRPAPPPPGSWPAPAATAAPPPRWSGAAPAPAPRTLEGMWLLGDKTHHVQHSKQHKQGSGRAPAPRVWSQSSLGVMRRSFCRG